MATNVILEYKRSADEWQCPICDAENSMSLGNCAVCGGAKSADATILRRWTPTPVVKRPEAHTPVMRRADYPVGRTFRDMDGTPPAEPDSKSGCITALMVVLVVLIIMLTIFLAMTQANGEELASATEHCTETSADYEYTQNSGRYEYVL